MIDDYGHHPTEIRATLAAARQCGFGKIHVIFQPHRYTRTRDLMDEFAGAFEDADSVAVLDIYAASEVPIEGITGEALARRISENRVKEDETGEKGKTVLRQFLCRWNRTRGCGSPARRHDFDPGRRQRIPTRAQ